MSFGLFNRSSPKIYYYNKFGILHLNKLCKGQVGFNPRLKRLEKMKIGFLSLFPFPYLESNLATENEG
jgi:hypothetical protein